jgi:hypothetical protein
MARSTKIPIRESGHPITQSTSEKIVTRIVAVNHQDWRASTPMLHAANATAARQR